MFRIIVVFDDEDASSEFEGGATLAEARSKLCVMVRRERSVGRTVHEADIYQGDRRCMTVPVDYLVTTHDWDNWCGAR